MTRSSRLGLVLLMTLFTAVSVGTLRGVEPPAAAKAGISPPQSVGDAASPYAAWEGEWTFSRPLNQALGFPETLQRGENHGGMPPAFRLTLDKTLGASLPEGELEELRRHAFDEWGLKVVATGCGSLAISPRSRRMSKRPRQRPAMCFTERERLTSISPCRTW